VLTGRDPASGEVGGLAGGPDRWWDVRWVDHGTILQRSDERSPVTARSFDCAQAIEFPAGVFRAFTTLRRVFLPASRRFHQPFAIFCSIGASRMTCTASARGIIAFGLVAMWTTGPRHVFAQSVDGSPAGHRSESLARVAATLTAEEVELLATAPELDPEVAARPRLGLGETIDGQPIPVRDGFVLLEGDILVPEGFDDGDPLRGTYANNLWPGGVVPYQFDANVSAGDQAAMLAAMAEWEVRASVDFRPRAGESSYVHIFSGTGNWSYVGRVGGRQDLSIYNWNYRFIMAHELAHALGVWHEQSRPDRGSYVQINYQNISQTACSGSCSHNFDIRGTAHGPYDFDSVMHYGQYAFSSNGLPTITVLPPNEQWQPLMGHVSHLSVGDAALMVSLYGTDCNGNLISDNTDITTGTSADCNSNGIPDECEQDTDGDGRINPCDNCPTANNPGQQDCNGNGVGDACDAVPCPDVTPPTPNPMTFAAAPAPQSISAVTMTATTAVDPSGPVQYYFDATAEGPFADDSGWQTSPTYTDTGLITNAPYSYRVRARDAVGNLTSYSTTQTGCTAIETPTNPIELFDIQPTSIRMYTIDYFTDLAFELSGLYFDSTTAGGDGGINQWIQDVEDQATGLSPNTLYTFRIRGRNKLGDMTSYGGTATAATAANVPGAPALSGAACNALAVSVSSTNGNPAATVYAIQCSATTPSHAAWVDRYLDASGNPSVAAVYRTAAQWGTSPINGLNGSTNYTFRVKARNLDGLETAFGATAARSTSTCATCFDGVLNQNEVRIDCGGVCAACECTSDAVCGNSNVCDGAEACDAFGECTPGLPLVCNDSNLCTTDSCHPISGCSFTSITCDDDDDCTTDSCDGQIGCVFEPFACDTGACCTVGGCTDSVPEACGYVCDVMALRDAGFLGCYGDADGNNVVNAADRGAVSANLGQATPDLVCIYDLDGNGVVNAADRGVVAANLGQCVPLPDYQNGSGLSGGLPDARFGSATFLGLGTSCATAGCP
jgi:hypothetical protein